MECSQVTIGRAVKLRQIIPNLTYKKIISVKEKLKDLDQSQSHNVLWSLSSAINIEPSRQLLSKLIYDNDLFDIYDL